MKYVRNTLSPSRMNTLWPCHSSTPKSLSKLSVIVYHGMAQPIRAFSCSISFCDVREARVAGVQMGQMRHLIGAQGTAAAGVLGPAEHPGLEEGAIHDQLPAAL